MQGAASVLPAPCAMPTQGLFLILNATGCKYAAWYWYGKLREVSLP